nr:hypothetical protein [Tanacetum cinerariifolium]
MSDDKYCNAIQNLTKLLRLPFLPAFSKASKSRDRMAHGLNFATAAAGILDDTCRNFTDDNVEEFLNCGYEYKWIVDLYTKHFDYDVLDLIDFVTNVSGGSDISDEYDYSEEDDDLDYVYFQTEGEENLIIPNVTSTDQFLNKLYSNNGYFRGFMDEPVLVNNNILEVDPDESNIANRFKIKKVVSYPKFDLSLEWNKMAPILGVRFYHLKQLRLMLVNYGVANGYQLWYAHNYWKCILVQYGMNIEDGRCAGAYSKKNVQKKWFDDAYDVAGLSDKGKSEIHKSTPALKPKSEPGPKPKSKNGNIVKTKTVTFRKLIFTRSRKDGEGTSIDCQDSLKQTKGSSKDYEGPLKRKNVKGKECESPLKQIEDTSIVAANSSSIGSPK